MNTLKKFAFKRTILFSILLIISTVAVTFIPLDGVFNGLIDKQSINYIAGIFEQILVSIVIIFMLKKFGLVKQAGFNTKIKWKSLLVMLPIFFYLLINLSDWLGGNIKINTSKPVLIILFILTYATTGLFEETLCRGAILTLMLVKWGKSRKGCYLALIVSSFLFGSTHIVHFFLHDASLLSNLTQITYATFIGIFFGAIVIRTKSIYPAMVLHAVFDITGSLKEIAINGGIQNTYMTITPSDALVSVLIFVPLCVYSLFIFRKVKCSDFYISAKGNNMCKQ